MTNNLEKIKELGAAIRLEFREKVALTGLEIADDRGGSVLITGYGNKGRDVAGELERQGLPAEEIGRGAYRVSAFPLLQRRLTQ